MIAINQSIPSKIISCSNEAEALTVQLLLKQPIKIILYHPPNSESSYTGIHIWYHAVYSRSHFTG